MVDDPDRTPPPLLPGVRNPFRHSQQPPPRTLRVNQRRCDHEGRDHVRNVVNACSDATYGDSQGIGDTQPAGPIETPYEDCPKNMEGRKRNGRWIDSALQIEQASNPGVICQRTTRYARRDDPKDGEDDRHRHPGRDHELAQIALRSCAPWRQSNGDV